MTIKDATNNFAAIYSDKNIVSVQNNGKEIIVCILERRYDFYPSKYHGYKIKYTKPVWVQKT